MTFQHHSLPLTSQRMSLFLPYIQVTLLSLCIHIHTIYILYYIHILLCIHIIYMFFKLKNRWRWADRRSPRNRWTGNSRSQRKKPCPCSGNGGANTTVESTHGLVTCGQLPGRADATAKPFTVIVSFSNKQIRFHLLAVIQINMRARRLIFRLQCHVFSFFDAVHFVFSKTINFFSFVRYFTSHVNLQTSVVCTIFWKLALHTKPGEVFKSNRE